MSRSMSASTEVPGEEATTYEVHVAPGDLGKVIGKQGRIANALRTVAKAVAMKAQAERSTSRSSR